VGGWKGIDNESRIGMKEGKKEEKRLKRAPAAGRKRKPGKGVFLTRDRKKKRLRNKEGATARRQECSKKLPGERARRSPQQRDKLGNGERTVNFAGL